jgi:hypothetical protein
MDDMKVKKGNIVIVGTDIMIDFVKFKENEPDLFKELAEDYPAEEGNYLLVVGGK